MIGLVCLRPLAHTLYEESVVGNLIISSLSHCVPTSIRT